MRDGTEPETSGRDPVRIGDGTSARWRLPDRSQGHGGSPKADAVPGASAAEHDVSALAKTLRPERPALSNRGARSLSRAGTPVPRFSSIALFLRTDGDRAARGLAICHRGYRRRAQVTLRSRQHDEGGDFLHGRSSRELGADRSSRSSRK